MNVLNLLRSKGCAINASILTTGTCLEWRFNTEVIPSPLPPDGDELCNLERVSNKLSGSIWQVEEVHLQGVTVSTRAAGGARGGGGARRPAAAHLLSSTQRQINFVNPSPAQITTRHPHAACQQPHGQTFIISVWSTEVVQSVSDKSGESLNGAICVNPRAWQARRDRDESGIEARRDMEG